MKRTCKRFALGFGSRRDVGRGGQQFERRDAPGRR